MASSISENTFSNLFAVALKYYQKENVPSSDLLKNPQHVNLVGSLLHAVEIFLRSQNRSVAVEKFSQNLGEIGFPNSKIPECVSTLEVLKLKIQNTPKFRNNHLPSLEQLNWRVDITISSSVLSRVFEPSLVLDLELSNGKKVAFEVSVTKFHKLRYTIASILKDFEILERKMNAIKL